MQLMETTRQWRRPSSIRQVVISQRIGLLIKALSISALGRGCGIAVTYPAPFEGDAEDVTRDRAIAALGAHWSELGFEHFKDGVWVLDLSAITFTQRMDALLSSLG